MVSSQELVDSIWNRLEKKSGDATHHKKCGSCSSGDGEGGSCGNGLEKIYPTTAVRYGYMNFIGEFSHDPNMKFSCGGKIIIRTERGIELGEQVSLTCHGCSSSVSRDQLKLYAENSGPEFYRLKDGQILREATPSDLADYEHLQQSAPERNKACREVAQTYGLDMKVLASEHLFGGERIVFYFMAEGRIDFRQLVRDLAAQFHTRIEMRQVGARDEARLLADYETCGRECCCKNFLKTLRPVSMKMAKLQKATLDPSKVSGRCGRLKCCLRYEHESYEELDRKLPRFNKLLKTAHGEGIVVDRQVLTQLVQIQTASNQRITVVAEDIIEVLPKPPDWGRVEPQEEKGGDSRRGGRDSRQGRGRPRNASADKPAESAERKEDAPPDSAQQDNAGDKDSKSRSSRRRRPRRRKRGGGDGGGENAGDGNGGGQPSSGD